MPLTSLEELALEEGVAHGLKRGFQVGLRQGIIRVTLRLLQTRFGEDALRLRERLERIESIEQLETLSTEAAFAPSLEAFEQKLG
jgi:hypothetical protein